MERKRVSLVKFENREDVARAVEQIGGLDKLRLGDRVLLKPNLVMWDSIYPYPKYGVLTTSLVMEEMVRLLKAYGCTDITIGEGSIVDKGIGSSTSAAFAGLGYQKLKNKYGVKLIDFNDGPFETVQFDGYSLDVSSHALHTDFLINLPVLKTHNSTKVSLGLKNLKGCLQKNSKMFCHHKTLPLDGFISQLASVLSPSLTLIDGIYALEKGPVMNGRAFRTNVLIASNNPYAADVVGARVLGYDPADIHHLREYGEEQGLCELDIDIVGEELISMVQPLKWDWEWLPDNSGPEGFARQGISELYFPKYDNTICSGCSYLNTYLLVTLMGAYAKESFGNMEFLGGKNCTSQGGYNKTFLFGRCAMKENKDNPAITEAVPIRGCPPTQETILKALTQHGIQANGNAYAAYRSSLFNRYRDASIFREEDFQVL